MKRSIITSSFYLPYFLSLILFLLLIRAPSARAAECKAPEYKPEKQTYSGAELVAEFREAHGAYHGYINCLFGNATDAIIPPDEATTPMSAEAVCSPETKIVATLKKNNTVDIMRQGINAYNAYTDKLQKLRIISGQLRTEGNGEEISFNIQKGVPFQYSIDKEIQYALVAFDRSLMAFSEMRIAYALHRHFQCVQSYLEKALGVVEKFRAIITGLPSRIKDASIH